MPKKVEANNFCWIGEPAFVPGVKLPPPGYLETNRVYKLEELPTGLPTALLVPVDAKGNPLLAPDMQDEVVTDGGS